MAALRTVIIIDHQNVHLTGQSPRASGDEPHKIRQGFWDAIIAPRQRGCADDPPAALGPPHNCGDELNDPRRGPE